MFAGLSPPDVIGTAVLLKHLIFDRLFQGFAVAQAFVFDTLHHSLNSSLTSFVLFPWILHSLQQI
ncbi:hypothetical protein CIT14_19520 [Virgibacillus profundi]|nr:hypothetical protein CIT14_19520 [Virgibacillus profundi]